jgi:hypothetical protein
MKPSRTDRVLAILKSRADSAGRVSLRVGDLARLAGSSKALVTEDLVQLERDGAVTVAGADVYLLSSRPRTRLASAPRRTWDERRRARREEAAARERALSVAVGISTLVEVDGKPKHVAGCAIHGWGVTLAAEGNPLARQIQGLGTAVVRECFVATLQARVAQLQARNQSEAGLLSALFAVEHVHRPKTPLDRGVALSAFGDHLQASGRPWAEVVQRAGLAVVRRGLLDVLQARADDRGSGARSV